MEDNNTNLMGQILGSLISNKGDGENNFGGNWMWVIFFLFMVMWGGNGFNGFGNRGNFFGPPPATQNDVAVSTAWGQTQDALRDVIQAVNSSSNGVVQSVREVNQNVGNVNQALAQLGYNQLTQSNLTNQQISQLGYNQLAQSNNTNQQISQLGYNQLNQNNETNQQIAQKGFDLQTAIMAGNNLLQGTIMGGNSMLQNNLQQATNDTQRAIFQTGNATQSAIQQMNGDTKLAICQNGNATQNAIFQTGNATQSAIQQMNGDTKLAICQANNNTQSTVNANGNAIQAAIRETGNNAIQGITSLGFLTQQKTDELKYELAKSTCAITSNDTANTQKVLDKLCMMEANMQAAKIQELQVANQALMLSNQVKDIQAGQIASAGFVINSIRPYPVPAYTVGSPYGTTTGGTTTGG